MNICDLKTGTRATILHVEGEDGVRDRLISLGLYAGARVTLLRVSPLKHTYLVQTGGSRIAMRREVARGIQVWIT